MISLQSKARQLCLNGVFLLDKPIGLTSNAALQKVKRLLAARKAGHTGSLDPLASGLLPICLGEATKLAGFLLDTDKRYRTTIRLGATTDTADATGQWLTRAAVPALDEDAIDRILDRFRGRIDQVPPMYSALKQSGVRLYDLARQGIEVDRPKRGIEIFELTLISYSDTELELDVHCSKGTYIRVLAEDIGRTLGCGAYVETLCRTAVGPWTLAGTLSLNELQELQPAERLARIEPMDTLVSGLPRVECDAETSFRLCHGQIVSAPHLLGEGLVRLYDPRESFLGIGESRSDGTIAPRRMFNLPHAPSHRDVSPGIDTLSLE